MVLLQAAHRCCVRTSLVGVSGGLSSRQKAARCVFSSGGCCHRDTIVVASDQQSSHQKPTRGRMKSVIAVASDEAVHRRVRRQFNIVPGGQSARARVSGGQVAVSRALASRKSSSPHRWTDLVSGVASRCSQFVVATRLAHRSSACQEKIVTAAHCFKRAVRRVRKQLAAED